MDVTTTETTELPADPAGSGPVSGPGGRQVLLADPDGNLVELFQPARHPAGPPRPPSGP